MLSAHYLWIVLVFNGVYYIISAVETIGARDNHARDRNCGVKDKKIRNENRDITLLKPDDKSICTLMYEPHSNSNKTLEILGKCVAEINCDLPACNITPSTDKECTRQTTKIWTFVTSDEECPVPKQSVNFTWYIHELMNVSFTITRDKSNPFVFLTFKRVGCPNKNIITTTPDPNAKNTDTAAAALSGTSVATDNPTQTSLGAMETTFAPYNLPTTDLDSYTTSGKTGKRDLIKILLPVILIIVLAIVVVASLIIYHKRKRSRQRAVNNQKEDKEVVENVIYSAAAPLSNGSQEGILVDNVIYGQNDYHVIDT